MCTEDILKPHRANYRVLLVDDNTSFLDMARDFLSEEPDLTVVGTLSSPLDVFDHIQSAAPNVAILDLSMPDTNGLELTRMLRQRHPMLRIIVLTLLNTPHHRKAALDAGADAFVVKSSMDDELIPAIRRLKL
ncbi:MAG: response regulator transcription factor [Chloroflexi bacterium]|nr:response regulator transcription factor [Chloroflexota bacterium]